MNGKTAIITGASSGSDESVQAAVGEVIRRAGRIDLLVNSTGFTVAHAGGEEASIEQAQSVFDTNFFGIVRMTRAIVPHMRRQGSGRIVNISSVLGFLPAPYMALYGASKHAVEGYSQSLDHELRSMGIRVSVVSRHIRRRISRRARFRPTRSSTNTRRFERHWARC